MRSTRSPQTATTVGYGDFSPITWQGRLISIFYMPFGTVVTMGGLLQPVGFFLTYIDRANALLLARVQQCARAAGATLMRGVPSSTWKDAYTSSASWQRMAGQRFRLKQLFSENVEVGPLAAYTHALLAPVVVALIGCVVTSAVRSTSVIDSLYYGVVTMTTVGYGDADLLPNSDGEKAFTMVFMLFSTTALAVCIERLSMLVTSRRIYKKEFIWELPAMMRRRAIEKASLSPTLVEDEFVLHVLQQYGVVDDDLLKCIREDFKKIEHFGVHPNAADGEIEVRTLYDHLVAQGQVVDANRVAPGTTREGRQRLRLRKFTTGLAMSRSVFAETVKLRGVGPSLPKNMVVDMAVMDQGFEEWRDDIWTPFLERDTEYAGAVRLKEERDRQPTVMHPPGDASKADSVPRRSFKPGFAVV
jgi:hypothetical protein